MSKHHPNRPSQTAASQDPTDGEPVENRLAALKDSVLGLADVGSERAAEVEQTVTEAKDKAVASVDENLEALRARIVESPLAAVAIAFGIGYIAMRIFR